MIDNPFSEKGSIDMTTTIVPFGGGYKSEEKTRYMGIDAILVKVIFSNFPKNPTEENNARNVRAQISYSDALGNTLFSARGRWEVSKSEDCENIELNQMAYQKHYI